MVYVLYSESMTVYLALCPHGLSRLVLVQALVALLVQLGQNVLLVVVSLHLLQHTTHIQTHMT